MEKDMNIELMTMIRSTENIIKRSRGDHNVKGYGRILSHLKNGRELTQSELAEELEIRPQSLTRILSEMETEGMIIRTRDKDDRRILRVAMSEKGKKDFALMQKHRAKRAETIFGCLDEKEKKELMTLLDKVITSYNEKEGDRV